MPKKREEKRLSRKEADEFMEAYHAMWYAMDSLGEEAAKAAFRNIANFVFCEKPEKKNRFRSLGSMDDNPPDIK